MNVTDQRVSYVWASIAGLVLIGLLFAFVDAGRVFEVAESANLILLAAAMIPFCFEVVCTSSRIQHCVNHPVAFHLATYSNSIYMVWLTILPARLGELAGITVFNRKLGMSIGSAIASLVVQRIYDVLILSSILIAVLSQTLFGGLAGLVIASAVFCILLMVLVTLPFWLERAARVLLNWRHRKFLKKLLFVCLQARTWYRHQSESQAILWLAGTTLGKWLFNLAAIFVVFQACGVELEALVVITVGVLMHFLGAIPLQSFGGFGVSDVGLVGILISYGVPAELAVATSVIFRLVAICFVMLFFAFCFLFIRPRPNE